MGGEPNVIWSWLESISAPLRQALAWLARWVDVFGLCFGAAALILALLHSASWPSAHAWGALSALPAAQIAAVAPAAACQATVVVRGRLGSGDRELAGACREEYEGLPADERLGLSWAEFQRTRSTRRSPRARSTNWAGGPTARKLSAFWRSISSARATSRNWRTRPEAHPSPPSLASAKLP